MPTETFFNLPPEKRRRIVDAALDEFAEASYDTVSISRLVARADIAKGSFYQYFESKADLFEWLTFHEIARRKVAFIQAQPLAPVGSDFFGTIEALVIGGLKFALSDPRLARITEALWRPSADPELRALATRARDLGHQSIRTMLLTGQSAGQVRLDLDLDLAADVLMVTLQQGADRALWHRYGFDILELMQDPRRAEAISEAELRELVSGVIDIIRRGLGGGGGVWAVDQIDVAELTKQVLGSEP